MTITRIGTNAQYASGWEAAFAKGKSSAKKAAKPAASKKKAAGKKKGKK